MQVNEYNVNYNKGKIMAIYIPETVEVDVFLESAPSTNQSFEFPLVAIPHNLSGNVVDTFSLDANLSSLTAAGAAINSPWH